MYNGPVGSVYSSENSKSTAKINRPKTPWNLQHFSKFQTEHSNSSFLAYDFQTLLLRTSPVCLHILHLLRLLSSGNSTDDIPTAAPRGLWGSRGDVAESERVEGLTYTRQTNILRRSSIDWRTDGQTGTVRESEFRPFRRNLPYFRVWVC